MFILFGARRKTTERSNNMEKNYPHWHKSFFPSIPTILFLNRPFLFSLLLCTLALTLVVFDSSWLKIAEVLHKMAIYSSEFQRQIILSQKTDRNRASLLNIWLHSSLFSLLICSSLSLMLSCTGPKFHLVSLLPRISLFTLFLYQFCPRHDTRRRSLFMRVSRDEWPVPQLTEVYRMLRVPRNPGCTLLPSRSLLPWSKKVSRQLKFCLQITRETLRADSASQIGSTKINSGDWKVRCRYPWMLVNWTCLCFSLALCSRTLTLIVVDSSLKIEESLHKMAISFSALKRCTE